MTVLTALTAGSRHPGLRTTCRMVVFSVRSSKLDW